MSQANRRRSRLLTGFRKKGRITPTLRGLMKAYFCHLAFKHRQTQGQAFLIDTPISSIPSIHHTTESMTMRKAREDQFDPNRPPWLHCTSRCVRRAYLCGDGYDHRKRFIEARLRQLASFFAVEVSAYAVMSNHLHVIARPRPDQAQELSAEAVAVAWLALRDLPVMARDDEGEEGEEGGDGRALASGEAGASSAGKGTASPSALPVGPVANDPATDAGRQARIAELAAND